MLIIWGSSAKNTERLRVLESGHEVQGDRQSQKEPSGFGCKDRAFPGELRPDWGKGRCRRETGGPRPNCVLAQARVLSTRCQDYPGWLGAQPQVTEEAPGSRGMQ